MVRLKGFCASSLYPCRDYFNSTMVRLKAFDAMQKSIDNEYFNSTMVRLKVLVSIIILHLKVISIPLWYD